MSDAHPRIKVWSEGYLHHSFAKNRHTTTRAANRVRQVTKENPQGHWDTKIIPAECGLEVLIKEVDKK